MMIRSTLRSAIRNINFALGVRIGDSYGVATAVGASKGILGHKYSTHSGSKIITCRAAVCRGAEERLKVEEIQVEPPRWSEIRVKMLYASLCHTDILCAKGVLGPLYPRVLGHEGVGVVESVGSGVQEFKEGDLVIPTFVGECKVCEYCTSGKTNICLTYPMPFTGLLPDGTSRISSNGQKVYHLFTCATWSEYAVMNVNYAVKVDSKMPLSHASLLSCGFSSGFGAPWKESKVEKGSTVAVMGLGAVGLGAIEGARVQGASRIIGIDRNKLKAAKGKAFGMTDFINPNDDSSKSVSELVKDVTGGIGVDLCIECSGAAPLVQEALVSTKPGIGTTVLISAGNKPTTDIAYRTILDGRTLKGSAFGGIKAKSELPTVIENILNKGTPLNELLTHEISLDEIDKAFDLLKQPDCVKVLIKI